MRGLGRGECFGHNTDAIHWHEVDLRVTRERPRQWRWRSFLYFFTNISHVIPHVIYVKILKLSLGRSLCTRQDLGCPPMCGQGQGFTTKRATFGERVIILHTKQVRLAKELSSFWLWSLSLTSCFYIVSCYAMYDLCI